MLSHVLAIDWTKHRLWLVRFSLILDMWPYSFLPLSNQPSNFWVHNLVLHTLYRTWFHSFLIVFRAPSSHVQQNDSHSRSNGSSLLPLGSTGHLLRKDSFDMYSGGRSLHRHCVTG
jgi:hypothetical protein